MRRREKEITDWARIEDVIGQAAVCRLGLCGEGRPYIVPMSFGYENRTLYFHSAGSGRKIDILRENPEVCFEMDVDVGIKPGDIACRWSVRYKSVIGYGKAVFLSEAEEKRAALNTIMKQYSTESFDYSETALAKATVFKVAIREMSGKQSD